MSRVAGVRVAVPAAQNAGAALRVEGMDGRESCAVGTLMLGASA